MEIIVIGCILLIGVCFSLADAVGRATGSQRAGGCTVDLFWLLVIGLALAALVTGALGSFWAEIGRMQP